MSEKNSETIIYFKHGLGNLIMMTPAIKALASMDSFGCVDICMSSTWEDSRRPAFDDFLNHFEIVNKVINYPKQELSLKYKTWFYTGHSEYFDALDIFKRNCPIEFGAPNWRENGLIHEVFYYMNAAYAMGYKGSIPSQSVPVSGDIKLEKNSLYKIGLCNGTYSYKMKTAKQWNYFQELSDLLHSIYNAEIIKLGYADELNDVRGDIDYVGKLSFTETAKVIQQLDLLITTDTALMHVGDALGIPMIVIFGGTLISKNGALSQNATHVKLGLPCQPCQRTQHFYNCDHYDCINKLTVDYIIEAVRRKLNVFN